VQRKQQRIMMKVVEEEEVQEEQEEGGTKRTFRGSFPLQLPSQAPLCSTSVLWLTCCSLRHCA
jgi:hypothetical protein